jgi:glycosyltransferase involved in cell wall biosynthesis
MLPKIADDLSKPVSSFGGWLTGLSNDLLKLDEVQLTVCFPITFQDSLLEGEVLSLKYFGFPQLRKDLVRCSKQIDQYMEEIIKKASPDIIHIFGTEYSHTLNMVNICERLGLLDNVVINIQGLVSVIPIHYYASLPNNVVKAFTLRDLVKKNNISDACNKMKKRGNLEIIALMKAKNIIGRTTWDKACTLQINPHAKYHFCNESLREEFYKYKWSIENCEKFAIFTSQASYPIKGVHFMLEAMPLILRKFPKAKLYIAGNDITKSDTFKEKLKRTSYARYIIKLIHKYNLQENVIFTGVLNDKEMCKRYLKSNVFVCPSSIENSPNSLGEAMLLGVPCVASDVGGVSDMLNHKKEGFVYQADAPYMLAHYVCQIFEKKDLAVQFSRRAREHALLTHDKETNIKRLMEIYNNMIKKT